MGKDKDIKGKLRWNLMPVEELKQVMKAIENGAIKYEPNGWKESKDPIEFYDALNRHLIEWKSNYDKGEIFKKDGESGLNPLAHVAANALFLLFHFVGKRGRYKNINKL